MARLVEIARTCRYADLPITCKIEIHIGQEETSAIKCIEEIDSDLEISGFSNPHFLQDVEVFGVKVLTTQIRISRRRVPKEAVWICIISSVRRCANSAVPNRGSPVPVVY